MSQSCFLHYKLLVVDPKQLFSALSVKFVNRLHRAKFLWQLVQGKVHLSVSAFAEDSADHVKINVGFWRAKIPFERHLNLFLDLEVRFFLRAFQLNLIFIFGELFKLFLDILHVVKPNESPFSNFLCKL